jgi:hypothetical protein
MASKALPYLRRSGDGFCAGAKGAHQQRSAQSDGFGMHCRAGQVEGCHPSWVGELSLRCAEMEM